MKRAGYVSVRQAAVMSGISERQLWRRVSDDPERPPRFPLRHERDAAGHVWIALEDVPERQEESDELRAEVEALRSRLADAERRIAALEKRPNIAPVRLYGDSGDSGGQDTASHQPSAPRLPVAPLSASFTDVSGHGDGDKPYGNFAESHGVPERTAQHHRKVGYIGVTSTRNPSRPSQQNHRVTPEQQRGALEYWRDHWQGVDGHGLRRCGDSSCSCTELLPA